MVSGEIGGVSLRGDCIILGAEDTVEASPAINCIFPSESFFVFFFDNTILLP